MATPSAIMAIGSVFGVLGTLWLSLPVTLLSVLSLLSLYCAALRQRLVARTGLFFLGLCLGQVAVQWQPPAPTLRQNTTGRVVTRTGHSALLETTAGNVWARFNTPAPAPGTWVTGFTRPGYPAPVLPNGWLPNAQATLARATRARFVQWLQYGTPEPDPALPQSTRNASVIKALALGDRRGMSQHDKDRFRRTGTSHLLAISGLHVGMVSALGALTAWLISRPMCRGRWVQVARLCPAIGAVVSAVLYGSIVGWPVSTQRAAWMVLFAALCTLSDRRVHMSAALGFALLAVIAYSPSQLASLGCLLSFSAVAALIAWMPVTTGWLKPEHPWAMRWLVRSAAATTIATLGTLPVTALVFQELAPSAVLANLLAVPLFAGVAVPAALIGIHGPAITSAGFIHLSDLAISTTLDWLEWVDFGTITIAVGQLGALLMFSALALTRRPTLALLCICLALSQPSAHKPILEVNFPAIGQGSAVLIQWPDGKHWLIDGGPPSRRLLHWLRREGVHAIDTVFLSHPDIDHLGGLVPVLRELHVDTLRVPRRPKPDEAKYRELWLLAHQKEIPIDVFSDGADQEGSDNDNGLVLTIRHGRHRFLLLGDVGAEIEERIAKTMPSMDVVQVSHHGSRYSSSPALIAAARASKAVIQVGASNRYGHPHADTIEAWGTENILRTDIDGSIRFRTDGLQLTAAQWTPKTLWRSIIIDDSRFR